MRPPFALRGVGVPFLGFRVPRLESRERPHPLVNGCVRESRLSQEKGKGVREARPDRQYQFAQKGLRGAKIGVLLPNENVATLPCLSGAQKAEI